MNQEQCVAISSLAQGELLKSRCARALGTAGLVFTLGVAASGVAGAQTAPVGVPDRSFPESVTSTKDGTLYVGSFNLGGVVKAAPGGKAEQFIKPGAAGSRSVLGVLADEAQIETIKDGFTEPVAVTEVGNTLWVAEGKLSHVIGDNKEKDPGPFAIKPVTLSK